MMSIKTRAGENVIKNTIVLTAIKSSKRYSCKTTLLNIVDNGLKTLDDDNFYLLVI